jgi:hypothetical protein
MGVAACAPEGVFAGRSLAPPEKRYARDDAEFGFWTRKHSCYERYVRNSFPIVRSSCEMLGCEQWERTLIRGNPAR